MPASVDDLLDHYRMIDRERMRGLPIVNPRLTVEAIGFREYGGHRIGILVTPWFMNLVLLPDDDGWRDHAQGSVSVSALPSGDCEWTVGHDDVLGTYLTAVLFHTVADFPDQEIARAIAEEVLRELFTEPETVPEAGKAADGEVFSRRNLLTGLRAP